MPDVVSATRQILLNNMGITDIYGLRIPPSVVDTMPKQSIVIVPTGSPGLFDPQYMPIGDTRLDIRCYANGRDTGYDAAMALWKDVHKILKNIRQGMYDGLLVHWAKSAGGPIQTMDQETSWPMINSAWQIVSEDPK